MIDLLGTGDVAVSALIEGLPGVGKTEFALKLISRLADDGHFARGIYWLNAEGSDLTLEWARIAVGLGVSGTAEEMASSMLSQIAEATSDVLIMLDNVEEWSDESPPGPLPSSNAKLLITSRRRRLGGDRFQHFPLGVLSRHEARDLLSVIAGAEIVRADGFEDLLDHLNG